MIPSLLRIYREQFETAPEALFRAPGRINLIGEHTDYNEGFVLPAAIDRYAFAAAGRAGGSRVSLYSVRYRELVETELSDMAPVPGKWTNYIFGVVDYLLREGYPVGGFRMVVDSDIPLGAGLSSSAALESAACVALDRLFGLNLSRIEMARAGQMAEHRYAGLLCGIMDEFASVFGKKDSAILLDCRSLAYEEVPLRPEGYALLLLNTKVAHELASSAYNERREECAEGVRQIAQRVDGVKSLRDVNASMIHSWVEDPLIRQRCLYVVEENERVHQAVAALRRGDMEALGKLLYASHTGLSRQYAVSCGELDLLVDAVRSNPAVAGARMMGGGFGGCTLNLVRSEAVEALIAAVTEKYREAYGLEPGAYTAGTADGAMELPADTWKG